MCFKADGKCSSSIGTDVLHILVSDNLPTHKWQSANQLRFSILHILIFFLGRYGAYGVCFALKSWKEPLILFIYLITLGKDVTFPLFTKFKTSRFLSYLSLNRITKITPCSICTFGLSFSSVNSIILCAHHLLSD